MSTSLRDHIADYYNKRPDFVSLWQQQHPDLAFPDKPSTTIAVEMPVHQKEEEAAGSQ